MQTKAKKFGIFLIIRGICLVLSNVLTCAVLFGIDSLLGGGQPFDLGLYLRWMIFWHFTFVLIANVTTVHLFTSGKVQELIFFFSASLSIAEIVSYVLFSIIDAGFDFSVIDWCGSMVKMLSLRDWRFFGILALIWVLFIVFYVTVIDRRVIDFAGKDGIRGSGKLKQVSGNLENSRWMNDGEKKKIFKVYRYSKLAEVRKDGIPVGAKLLPGGKDMEVAFNSPCHSLVIGSTGSGKTTTFVSPMIQLLGATSSGSSMIVTDPKGELFSLHSKYLASRGYEVKVIDLRDTYASYRWNPLDSIWDNYEKYRLAQKNAYLRRDRVENSGLRRMDPPEAFAGLEKWYEFEGCAYAGYDHLVSAIKLYKKKIYDEVYEDLNDLVSVLIPVENEKDPMWEKGARSITFAVLLAMLEDSHDERLGMTKEKFNFFNLAKILQNSAGDYADLRNYFKGRSPLSKALSLSKQVCDAATQTRASYMSIVYEKLTLFNDAGICALTASSDFSAAELSEKPMALFLKIPDEKDTRHNLAAIFILNIYKTLIKVASATEELTLPRNVYFIMDEFGNMPKIEKFDKFITVGRSRKIWFTMIVQSYAQLNNVYGETVADIVKGNCGIKMFIGSNDMGTCKEYSELCGNITVATTSTSGSAHGETSYSTQTQVRPLIYPSELQRLNHPGDLGHSIIVTFGNFPLMTYFSPSFKVPFYVTGKMDTSENEERYFDESATFYNVKNRNETVLKKDTPENISVPEAAATEDKNAEKAVDAAADAKATEKTAAPETTEEEKMLAAFRAWKSSGGAGTFAGYLASLETETAEETAENTEAEEDRDGPKEPESQENQENQANQENQENQDSQESQEKEEENGHEE